MEDLKKPFKTVGEEIQILQSRGLHIPDLDDAKKKLLNNNYYTVINGYKHPFLKKGSSLKNEQFKEGTSFDEIFALYEFDCQLRALLLKYILRVEHHLKSVISHTFAGTYRDVPYPDYLNQKYFELAGNRKQANYQILLNHIETELDRQRSNQNPVLIHYETSYNNIPPWILMSMLSFGMVRIFYCSLKQQEQNAVSRHFHLYPHEMTSYLSALNTYRNSCAHDEVIYRLQLKNTITRKEKSYNKVYVIVLILKDMLDAEAFMSFYSELETYLNTLSHSLKAADFADVLSMMGIPAQPEMRKKELGPLEIGNALSLSEFHDVLKRYILPILPISSHLEAVGEDDPERVNARCKLLEWKNNCLYFAQSTTGNFLYRAHVANFRVMDGEIEVVREHLSTLIDYIHVFWNLSNLTAFSRDKVEIAFPNLCEQAYELTICSLMCNRKQEEAAKALSEAEMHFKREIGTASDEKRKDLAASQKNLKAEYEKTVQKESLAQRSLYQILNQIEIWANKTYEGQKKTFGIIFCIDELPPVSASFDYIDFLRSDFSATINDGLYSAVELYADGTFKSHIAINPSTAEDFPSIPYPFTGFASLCTENKVGVLLTASGDILIINDGKLCYTKHNGSWLRCNMDIIIEQIKEELGEETADVVPMIYQTITDLSYSRGGACIGIIHDDQIPADFQRMIEGGLLSVESSDIKRVAIKSLIKQQNGGGIKSFYELDRHLRRELLELDGATVFSKSGLIHIIGTIIKLNDSGSAGGGRTAAAMQLSEYGLAIKISQDGYVQLFKNREKILEILS